MFKNQIGCCCRVCKTGVLGPFCLYQGPGNTEEVRQLEQIDFRVHKDKPLCRFNSDFRVDSNGHQTEEVYYTDSHTPATFGGSMDVYLDEINVSESSWFLWGGYDKNGDYELGPIEWSGHNMSTHYGFMRGINSEHTDVPFERYLFEDCIAAKVQTLLQYLAEHGLALYPAYAIVCRFNAGMGGNYPDLSSVRSVKIDLLVIDSHTGTFPLNQIFGSLESINQNIPQDYYVIYTITAAVNENRRVEFHFPDCQLNICNCNTSEGSREGSPVVPLTSIDSNSYERIKAVRGNPGIFARVILHDADIYRFNNGEALARIYRNAYTYVFNPDGSLREYDNDLRSNLAAHTGLAGLYEVWLCKEHQQGYVSTPIYDNRGRVVDHEIYWGSFSNYSQLRSGLPCDIPAGVEVYSPPLLTAISESQVNSESVMASFSTASAEESLCIYATRTDRSWLGCTHCTVTECRSPTLPPISDAVSVHLRLPAGGGDYVEVRSRYCSPDYCSLYK